MVTRKSNPRTRITEVQKAFEADLYHRLVRDNRDPPVHIPLKREIIERIVDDDELGLRDNGPHPNGNGIFADGGIVTAQDDFEFTENPRRVASFEDWLHRKVEQDILQVTPRDGVIDARHWTSDYVRDASKQGIKHANREARRAGIDVRIPDTAAIDEPVGATLRRSVHQDILQSAYIRSYDELDGITTDMAVDISRTMSEGLSEGLNPQTIARNMNDRVDKVGLTRGRRLARTETMRAYNNHTLGRYGTFEVQRVRLLTFEPCSVCQAIEAGGPYELDDAPSIPADSHPNCVCSWAPAPNT